jgi:hypothetical protein
MEIRMGIDPDDYQFNAEALDSCELEEIQMPPEDKTKPLKPIRIKRGTKHIS